MYYVEDKEFGKVFLTLRRGMRNIVMRCKEGELYLTVPKEISPSLKDIQNIIDRNREQLRKMKQSAATKKPLVEYHKGMTIHCHGFDIIIEEQNDKAQHITTHFADLKTVRLGVPQGLDYSSINNKEWISKCLKHIAQRLAPLYLLPVAQDVSKELNVYPRLYEQGRGAVKLGHCTTANVISLSANLLFLPEKLIRYVICHELAHITHKNHSQQFHALVNEYTGGREAQLEQQLRAFPWPIIR